MSIHWHTGAELAETSGLELVAEVRRLRKRLADLEAAAAAPAEPDPAEPTPAQPARKPRKAVQSGQLHSQ